MIPRKMETCCVIKSVAKVTPKINPRYLPRSPVSIFSAIQYIAGSFVLRPSRSPSSQAGQLARSDRVFRVIFLSTQGDFRSLRDFGSPRSRRRAPVSIFSAIQYMGACRVVCLAAGPAQPDFVLGAQGHQGD